MPTKHLPHVNLHTPRLVLEVLNVEHAETMVEVLSSPEIYRFIDDTPPTQDFLYWRYRKQSDNWEGRPVSWHNWIITDKKTGDAMGYVQATIYHSRRTAELGWVVAPKYAGQGFASEAARRVMAEMIGWKDLCLLCTIDSRNIASQHLAQALGFTLVEPTPQQAQRWELEACAKNVSTAAAPALVDAAQVGSKSGRKSD